MGMPRIPSAIRSQSQESQRLFTDGTRADAYRVRETLLLSNGGRAGRGTSVDQMRRVLVNDSPVCTTPHPRLEILASR